MKNVSAKSIVSFFVLAMLLGTTFLMPVVMMDMEHHEGTAMVNCPFMFGDEAICAMSVFQHLFSWQVMFVSIPPQQFVFALLLLFVSLTVTFFRHLFDPPDVPQPQSLFLYRSEYRALLFATLFSGTAISPRAP